MHQLFNDYRLVVERRLERHGSPPQFTDVSNLGFGTNNTPHQYYIAHEQGIIHLAKVSQHREGHGQVPTVFMSGCMSS